jgi:Capsule assembly protein Wzi
LLLAGLAVNAACADPFIPPGRAELRVDLQRLTDDNVIQAPVTTWPISWQSIVGDLEDADLAASSPATRAAFDRVATELRYAEQTHRFLPHLRIGAVGDPIAVRSFSATPRADGELEGGISYTGDRLSFNVNLIRAADSADEWRADGSYVGFATRRWSFTAGYPERWWGPGMQGSLILSTNAKPMPQIGIQRLSVEGFEHRWLRWIGPWSVTTFLGQFDDERAVNDALLFGLRLTARPLPQLEVAFSRTAQLCGAGRSCGLRDFSNMLIGHDNRGTNVSAEDEPGNQLAGMDGRWSFRNRPLAAYWQWIGEDSRQGGPQIGSFLRLIGAERSGSLGSTAWQHRSYIEIANTICAQGGLGFGGNRYNCAYQHGTFRTGYRYQGRPLGYPTDTDSQSVSVISVLNGPRNQTFEIGAYSARINQGPVANQPHSLSTSPATRYGIDLSHLRDLPIGRLRIRLSLAAQQDRATGVTDRDSTLAVEWLLGYW